MSLPDQKVRGEFDPVRVSASRLNKYLECGVAFHRQYIERVPEKRSGSAALFGNVMHKALEAWALDRSRDLRPLIEQAWLSCTEGTVVRNFLANYQRISFKVQQAERQAAAAWESEPRNRGKKSMKPRATKHFKESEAYKQLSALLAEWIPILDRESPWRFTASDPLPALYDESFRVGRQYQAQRRGLPNAIHTEFGFDVEWNGFVLNGYIDNIEPVLSEQGELVGYAVNDYKSYAQLPPLQKDWRQGVMYDVAMRSELRERLGLQDLPIWVVFDYIRLGIRRDFIYTTDDHKQLLSELTQYRSGVASGIFLPAAKNAKPDFCSYPEDCCLVTRGEGCGQRGGLYDEEPED